MSGTVPISSPIPPRLGPQTASEAAGHQHSDVPGGVDETQESILRTTLALLEERGYANVTTDLIAAEAQVSKATLYRHWRTKQQLVVDAMRLHMNAMEVEDLGSFAAEVRWVLEYRLDIYRQPKILRLVGGLVGAATADPQLMPIFNEWVEQLSRAIRQIIQRGIARGDVRTDIDLHAAETLIAGVIARTVVLQQSFSHTTIKEIVDLIEIAVRPGSDLPASPTRAGSHPPVTGRQS